LAKGGRGGRGNAAFKSSRNTSPTEKEEGKPGEKKTFRFELKMIADVGFVGLPNVGKSTLLNLLTNASSKVANYQFTTLEPHLGVYYSLILADIPGLVEGASEGKGLGIKFLKHIERTRVLFHFVSAKSDDVVRDYKTIRKELQTYNKELLKKDEYVFLSQADEVSESVREKKLKNLKKAAKNAKSIEMLSVLEEESVKKVKKTLNEISPQ
jgi:GTP-binding protein